MFVTLSWISMKKYYVVRSNETDKLEKLGSKLKNGRNLSLFIRGCQDSAQPGMRFQNCNCKNKL